VCRLLAQIERDPRARPSIAAVTTAFHNHNPLAAFLMPVRMFLFLAVPSHSVLENNLRFWGFAALW
jgi:hypothetical protein